MLLKIEQYIGTLMVCLCIAVPLYAETHIETIAVSAFATEGLKGWDVKHFAGETEYTLVDKDGEQVVKALSQASASALFKKIRIDLDKTPYLNWSWLVARHLQPINEREKEGDDYAARVYVIIDGGVFFWKTRALSYVWSSYQPKGTTWPNAYTTNAKMLALESGDKNLGRWLAEKRNIRKDLRSQFGEDLRFIDGVALMTDTDNSQTSAVAYYRQLFFSSE